MLWKQGTITKHLILTVFITVAGLFYDVHVSAATLTDQIEKMAQKFSNSAEKMGLGTATIAIFPFEADEVLSKKKINFAVSELFSQKILVQRTLKLTERAQLAEVLKEQRLGASGLVDSKTAATVGHIIGAELLVLGNVIKLGNHYQITAKLIDAKTAELITSEIIEIPIETFESNAAPYLVLVPQKQAIGIFLTGYYGFLDVKKSASVVVNSVTLTPKDPDASTISLGGGVRYWPANDWMMEASYASFSLCGGKIYTVPNSATIYTGVIPSIELRGELVRLTVNRILSISQNFRLHLGAGAMRIKAKGEKSYVYVVDTGALDVRYTPRLLDFTTPLVRGGIEWRPQERFGWGIYGGYNLLKKSISQNALLTGGGSNDTVRIWKADLSPLSLETTLSLYF